MGKLLDITKFTSDGITSMPEVDEKDWRFDSLMVCSATPEKALPPKASIKKNFNSVIYDQKHKDCTSCAALACDSYYYHPSPSKYRASALFTYYQQRVDCGQNPKKDTGNWVKNALDAVRKYGACNYKVWPDTKPIGKKPSKDAYKDGLKGHEITKYYRIKSFAEVKKAINAGYPVCASFKWAFTTINPDTWILTNPTYDDILYCGKGHAIVIVGYDDEKELIELRNSWGKDWANGGYCYMTYWAAQNCLNYAGSYAITK